MAGTSSDVTHHGLHAVLVRPEATTGSGVLMLPTIAGIDEEVIEFAEDFAADGLTTLIWDPFTGQPPAVSREERHRRAATLSDAQAARDMRQWVDYMLGPLGLTRIGVVGYCLGGRYGLILCADDTRPSCFVSYYPTIETPRLAQQEQDAVARAPEIACPVHLVAAGHDHLTSPAVLATLEGHLTARHAPTIVQHYPDAEHAFLQARKRSVAANDQAVRLSVPQAHGFLKACLLLRS
jgi:carboxymethylenebutenolidase